MLVTHYTVYLSLPENNAPLTLTVKHDTINYAMAHNTCK
jgi:hypothetical protein